MNRDKFNSKLKEAAAQCRVLANCHEQLSDTRKRIVIEMAKAILDEAREAIDEDTPLFSEQGVKHQEESK